MSIGNEIIDMGKFMLGAYEKKGSIDKLYDVIIIGSGPAGFTAGIYAVRSGLETLLITGYAWGGQLMNATLIENYPGFPEGIEGPELMMRMRRQTAKLGVEFIEADATGVNLNSKPFKVYVNEEEFRGRALIIATGARHRELGLESERKFIGKGVSYCAICDAYFFRNMPVAVVGGGDSALTDAFYLSSIASEVYLIHRKKWFRASKSLVDQLPMYKRIKPVLNSVVVDILGSDKVEGLKIRDRECGEEDVLDVNAVFIAIGYVPAIDLFRGQLELTEEGFIKTYDYTKTSVPGVFAAGDAMDQKYQQLVTAAAFGAIAALDAEEFLRRSV